MTITLPRMIAVKGILLCGLIPVLVVGCGRAPKEEKIVKRKVLGSHFDPDKTGTIRGSVIWQGDHPKVPGFVSYRSPMLVPRGGNGKKLQPNPHAPQINANGGIENAVILLRGIDLTRSRPWDHPIASVVLKDYQQEIHQGKKISPVGFARRGDSFEMVSHNRWFYSLRARGASFFTLTFPDPFQPLSRQLENNGRVTFQSGAGRYWMRSYLFVDDHPYMTRTDAKGNFVLPQVPDGTYELICWMPNWHVKSRERHWGTTQVIRIKFHEPLQLRQSVIVEAGKVEQVHLQVAEKLFAE